MTKRTRTDIRMTESTLDILRDGIQRYLSRIPLGWWLCALAVLVGAVVWSWIKVKKQEEKAGTACGYVLSTLYFLSVILVTFGTRLPDPHLSVQLIPLRAYLRVATEGSTTELFQILCNILLFVPFGVLVPPLLRGKRTDSILRIAKYALFFSFGIEYFQLITRIGCFETDDMINNVLGAMIGYLALCIVRRIKRLCLKMFIGKTTEN